MRKQAWRFTTMLVLALALGVAGGDALAGKGGSKGKPGGGDGGGGGDPEPEPVLYELAFSAQIQDKGKKNAYCHNCSDVVLAQLSASGVAGLRRLTTDNPIVGESSPGIAFDALGDRVIFDDYNDGLLALDPELILDTEAVGVAGPPGTCTQRQDANDDLLPWDEQFMVKITGSNKGPLNPYDELPFVWDVAIHSLDGTVSHAITDFQSDWDEVAGLYTWTNADSVIYVPEQHDEATLFGLAWIFYKQRTESWKYDEGADPEYYPLPETVVEQWYRVTVSTTGNWFTSAPTIIGNPVAVSVPVSDGPYYYHRGKKHPYVTANGQYAYINRYYLPGTTTRDTNSPYVVKLDFSGSAPVFPAPTSSDSVPITPPTGFDTDEVQIRAVSEDGSMVALNLWKTQSGESYRHLFVATSAGKGLTRIDLDGFGINFRDQPAFAGVPFIHAAFRPAP